MKAETKKRRAKNFGAEKWVQPVPFFCPAFFAITICHKKRGSRKGAKKSEPSRAMIKTTADRASVVSFFAPSRETFFFLGLVAAPGRAKTSLFFLSQFAIFNLQ